MTTPQPKRLTEQFYRDLERRAADALAQTDDEAMRDYWARMQRKAQRLAQTAKGAGR